MSNPNRRFEELSRESETTAAYYSIVAMNAVVFVAFCLFVGFFLGEGMRLTHAGVSALHKFSELTR